MNTNKTFTQTEIMEMNLPSDTLLLDELGQVFRLTPEGRIPGDKIRFPNVTPYRIVGLDPTEHMAVVPEPDWDTTGATVTWVPVWICPPEIKGSVHRRARLYGGYEFWRTSEQLTDLFGVEIPEPANSQPVWDEPFGVTLEEKEELQKSFSVIENLLERIGIRGYSELWEAIGEYDESCEQNA